MKMIYRASLRDRLGRSPFVILLIGLFLVWLFSRPIVYGFGERLALTLARPFWSLSVNVLDSVDRLKQFFTSRVKLMNEIVRLQQNLAKLMAIEAERARLSFDNAVLREILNYHSQAKPGVVTAAKILTRANQSPFDVIVADIGLNTTKSPPQSGDLVIGGGVVALGRVATIYSRSIKIELYSSSGTKLDVLIGSAHIPAQAVGRGGGNFSVSLPRDLIVKMDDPVMMVHGEDEYLLGVVKVVDRAPSDAFQEILFRSPLNLELLSWIEIYGS